METAIAAIRIEIASRPKSAFRRTAEWLREWGILGATITAFVALLGSLIALIVFTVSGTRDNATFRTHTEDRLTNIESQLANVNSTLKETQLKQSAFDPASPASAGDAARVLADARKNATKLNPSVIQEAGQQFVKAAAASRPAWDTALQFLNYRSFLNAAVVPTGPKQLIGEDTNYYVPKSSADFSAPGAAMYSVGANKTPDVPQFREINAPDPNADKAAGPQYLLVTNLTLTLDGLFVKRVIVKDAHVVYHGGPVVLQGVYFVDCTFEIDHRPQGVTFASTLLASSAVTFSS